MPTLKAYVHVSTCYGELAVACCLLLIAAVLAPCRLVTAAGRACLALLLPGGLLISSLALLARSERQPAAWHVCARGAGGHVGGPQWRGEGSFAHFFSGLQLCEPLAPINAGSSGRRIRLGCWCRLLPPVPQGPFEHRQMVEELMALPHEEAEKRVRCSATKQLSNSRPGWPAVEGSRRRVAC